MSPKSKFLQELPQYHFKRDDFVRVFYEVFGDDSLTTEIYDMCTSGYMMYSFFMYRMNDEFYITHMDSGTTINWYKHLGRTNTCNKEGFTLDDLREFLQILKLELEMEMKRCE